MQPILIILRFFILIFFCFLLSFLLDFEIIKTNWLRYSLIVIFIFSILIIGMLWIKEKIKKLK